MGAVVAMVPATPLHAKPATVALQWKGMPLNRSTTFITAPRYPDGTVDYIKAINVNMSRGVTRKNNAAIGLLRAFGNAPGTLGRHWKQVLRQLHMPLGGMMKPQLIGYYAWRVKHGMAIPKTSTVPNPAHHPWSAQQHPARARYLKSMARYLRQVRHSARLSRYYVPWIQPKKAPRVERAGVGDVAAMRNAADVLAWQAMLELHGGHVRAARRNILTLYRMGTLISQQPTLINYFVAISISQLASEAQVALARYVCRHAPARRWATRISPPHIEPLAVAISTGERFLALDDAFAFFAHAPGLPRLSRRARTELHLNHKRRVFQRINLDYTRLARIAQLRNYQQAKAATSVALMRGAARWAMAYPKPNDSDFFYETIGAPGQITFAKMIPLPDQGCASHCAHWPCGRHVSRPEQGISCKSSAVAAQLLNACSAGPVYWQSVRVSTFRTWLCDTKRRPRRRAQAPQCSETAALPAGSPAELMQGVAATPFRSAARPLVRRYGVARRLD